MNACAARTVTEHLRPLKPEQARSGYNFMTESPIPSASWTQEARSSAISVYVEDGTAEPADLHRRGGSLYRTQINAPATMSLAFVAAIFAFELWWIANC
jgi:hypothetical protein